MSVAVVLFVASCGAVVRHASTPNSTLTLTTSAVKIAQGAPVTFSAAVSADHTVTGTVDFSDNGVVLSSGIPVILGRATLTMNSLSIGTHTITASYSGDGSTNKAATASLSQVVTGTFNVQINATSGSLSHNFVLPVTLQ
jgi:hypothetical protein